MSVLVYIENTGGQVKKVSAEAASYAKGVADMAGTTVEAVAVGPFDGGQLETLGKYGVSKVHNVTGDGLDKFQDNLHARAVAQAAATAGSSIIVIPQSYNGRPLAGRLAVKLNAGLLSGVIALPESVDGGVVARRLTNSGKGFETKKSLRDKTIITVKTNSYGVKTNETSVSVDSVAYSGGNDGVVAKPIELVKTSSTLSITEAEIVVSGGRGLKGKENWGVLLDLAEALGAGTACSKPVADMEWRPHHEHVGQTGIQIGPNLYIAMGISGAIQHLAGVNSSKNIVVINKDPDAPFFKIADYGIVGDLFEVVPKMTEAVKAMKASS